MNSEEFDKFLKKASRYLSYRPRSENEVFWYLKKKGCSENIIEKVMQKLKKNELLGDEDFADWWIEQRLTFKPRGRRALKNELYKKGLSRKLINKKVAEISKKELKKAAEKVVEKRNYKWKKLKKLEQKKKIYAYLSRRGFNYSVINSIIEKYVQSE